MIAYASFPRLAIAARKTADFGFVAISIGVVVFVAIHLPVSRVLWWLCNARLVVVVHDIAHAFKRHLNPCALLEHIFDFFKPRHGLGSHSNALILVRTLAVDLGKLGNAARTVRHLKELAELG